MDAWKSQAFVSRHCDQSGFSGRKMLMPLLSLPIVVLLFP